MRLQWRNFLVVLPLAAAVVTPAIGQSESAPALPDFSGIWAHANPGFEPLASGPTSLINRMRRANGTGDILNLTGDHTNPILKPAAAAAVQKARRIPCEWTRATRTRATNATSKARRSCSRTARRTSFKGRTRSPSSINTIIRSAMCA